MKLYSLLTLSSLILVCLLPEISCKKTSPVISTTKTFIKIIPLDTDFNPVNSFQASDGSYIVFGVDPKYTNPGLLVKFSATGALLWQKRLPANLTHLIKVIPVAMGTRFLATGFSNNGAIDTLYAYQYDINGNTVLSKAMEPFANSVSIYEDISAIQLRNGNFAFTGTVGDSAGYKVPFLMLTDNTFNILHLNTYNENCIGITLCESPDGSIDIAGQTYSAAVNTFLIRTNSNAVQKSFTAKWDSVTNESPDCIVANTTGIFIVSSKFFANGSGLVMEPYNTTSGTLWSSISGSIGTDRFDTGGHFNSRETYTAYSNNGEINSMRATQDGGYILCGTVNQLNNLDIVSSTEIYLVKLDGNMNEQWSKTFTTYYYSYGMDACQTSDGGYFISGQHFSFNNHFDLVIIKTDANGNVN